MSLIVLGASGLAVVWVFLVPVFQSPDEEQHLDYSFAIRDHGGLFTAEPLQPGEVPNYMVHPHTLYLMERTNFWSMIFHAEVKVSPDYGTLDYYRTLDRDAPSSDALHIERPPSLTKIYPFGYYALLAAWMGLLSWFSDSLVIQFFGARMLSVLLLACSILLGYGTSRELRLSRSCSLLLAAVIGFFPMTTFLGSYVQPDNLSFTLVSLCLYLGLVVRRRQGAWPFVAALGVALGALLVTKPHYYIAVLLPVAGMLAVEAARSSVNWRRRVRNTILLTLPTLALGGVHLWTVRNTRTYYSGSAPYADLTTFLVQGIRKVFSDFFLGTTHRSFWGIFGWMDTPLVVGSPRVDAVIRLAIVAGTLVVFALTLVRLEQNASRLVRIARRGRLMRALRLLMANPVLNSYFLFFAMMFVIFIRTDNRFAAQGRNWFPFLLPIFLTAVVYAPGALRGRATRRAFSSVIAVGLLLYSAAGSYYALGAIEERYYPKAAESGAGAVQDVSLPIAPIEIHQMNWDGAAGHGTGPDPYLIFALERPAFVRSITIRCRLSDFEGTEAPFQVFWLPTSQAGFSPEHSAARPVSVAPEAQTVVVPINETISQVRIDPATEPCRLELTEVILSVSASGGEITQ